jgi:hypothetical protein
MERPKSDKPAQYAHPALLHGVALWRNAEVNDGHGLRIVDAAPSSER